MGQDDTEWAGDNGLIWHTTIRRTVKQQYIFTVAYTLLVGVACLLATETSPTRITIEALVIACLLGAELLMDMTDNPRWWSMVFLGAVFVSCLIFGAGLFPLACVVVSTAVIRTLRRNVAIVASIVAYVLLAAILAPGWRAVVTTPVCVVPLFFLDVAFSRLNRTHRQLEDLGEERDSLRRQLDAQRKVSQAVEQNARLNERNRLASRIHDKIGHGISGSVLLVEGARLNMDTDPDRAKSALELAAENLRSSLDDIRASLRQERTPPSEAGLAQISALLTRFEAQRPQTRTDLATDGDLSEISPQVWECVCDNLTETLTNVVKHSDATHFSVSISVQNKLVTVSFLDNGTAGDFIPGMGLTAIEERCAIYHGNCFFTGNSSGFSTVMTFTHSDPRRQI